MNLIFNFKMRKLTIILIIAIVGLLVYFYKTRQNGSPSTISSTELAINQAGYAEIVDPPIDFSQSFNVTLQVKAQQPGLIFKIASSSTTQSPMILLRITHDGLVRVAKIIRTIDFIENEESILDNQWHSIRITRINARWLLAVDDEEPIIKDYGENPIETRVSMYFGSEPGSKLDPFSGCMKDIIINGKLQSAFRIVELNPDKKIGIVCD